MLLRILSFVLETVFFVLISATLLRAWMNGCSINMRVPLGGFVMAASNWLVKPLRRVLPKAWMQSKFDCASMVGAAALALAYALIWVLLSSALTDIGNLMAVELTAVAALAAKILVRVALQTTMVVVFIFALLSWLQPSSPTHALLSRLAEPLLSLLRRLIPTVGGIDLSVPVMIVVLQIGLMVLG